MIETRRAPRLDSTSDWLLAQAELFLRLSVVRIQRSVKGRNGQVGLVKPPQLLRPAFPGHARTAIEPFASICFSSYYLAKDALTSAHA